jgi:hypothetical protein
VLGASELAHRNAVAWRSLDLDDVAGADITFLDDAEVRAEATRELELLHE